MSALQIVAVVVCLGVTAVAVALLVKTVNHFLATFRLGQPEDRGDDKGARTRTLLREFLGHTRMSRLPVVAIAHWFTMVSFGVLFFTLLNAFGQLFAPDFVLPVIGHFFLYEWVTDFFAFAGFISILVLMAIRQKNHPRSAAGEDGRRSRFFGSTWWQAYYVELTILGVTLCIGLLRALEWTLARKTGTGMDTALHFPLTGWIGNFFTGLSIGAIENLIVVIAAIKIIISFAWMITIALQPTMGVAWHRFLAFFNIFFKRHADGRTSLGELQPIKVNGKPLDFENVDELDEDAALGVGKVEDFTWKGLLDFTTCTECGRCQSQCPAWNTDKPLSPKMLVMALRDHAHAKAPWLLATESEREALGEDAAALAEVPLIGDTGYDITNPLAAYNPHGPDAVIDQDVLWSCTTCGACVEQCPVDIEHVDHIVDMRRYQVLIESAFPSEAGTMLRNIENKGNPWGMANSGRDEWMKELSFEVRRATPGTKLDADIDYLFWVGCAGALEDRSRKVTVAFAELLHVAGVEFAVLGQGESCTGDPARRLGNEFVYQMQGMQNVETLNSIERAGPLKIVATCPHCFNTIANEYPQLGGHYEVVHHTQLLGRLVEEGRLTPIEPVDKTVTYHDPCYLGRHNKVYTPPREVLAAIPSLTSQEMHRCKDRGFCCGAGGARFWMEEKIGKRINRERTDEAIGLDPDMIGTACPFCMVMLSDAVAEKKGDGSAKEHVEVLDVAQILRRSLGTPSTGDSQPEAASTS
jgi:Fe-S oxidoreductase